ncbi:MAG: winged helix-turn-helix domain-containing protein [Nanoarchaeota archaeon]|nr:winged helix-turn-helix domain-containing protein [Nanoarchaeota archaeon]MBU0977031.1 winged helix-turn-helix domain-containing protein [Nanoarchaeota archaeon]
MIPKNKKKIILYLLKNPEIVNINQISKKLDISVGSAFKILKELEKNHIVLSSNLGNAKFYQINLNNKETIHWCEILLSEEKRNLKGHAKIYAEEIQKSEHAEIIVLFGSVLTNREFNDVDVLFITNQPKEVTKFCLNLSKIRTKPVVPLILKKEDFIKEIKNKKEVILDILKTGIILKGESRFIEVLKNVKQQK